MNVSADKKGLPSDVSAPDSGEITVRRYAMKRSGRSRWLRRYMNTTEYVDYSVGEMTEGERKRRRKKAKILRAVILAAVAVALLIPLIGFVLSQVEVTQTVISGDCAYTAAELCEAAGIGEGCRLFDVNREKAASAVKERYAKLSYCKVSLKFPGTVIFTVKTDNPVLYAEIDGEYYSVSKELKVLERSAKPDVFIAQGLVFAEIPDTVMAIVGRKLVFDGGVDGAYISEFIDLLDSRGLLSSMTKLFLENRFDLVAIDSGKYRIRFGTSSDLSVKLSTAERIAGSTPLDIGSGADIDVSCPGTSGMLKVSDFNPNLRSQ